MSRARASRGFTLIEVLTALAILGLGMFILLDAHYGALRMHDTMNDAVISRQLLEQIVNYAEVEVLIGNLSDSGDFGARHPGYTWSYQGSQTGGGAGLFSGNTAGVSAASTQESGTGREVRLYEVTASITNPDGEERSIDFLVYNLNPENDDDSMFNTGGGSQGRGQ